MEGYWANGKCLHLVRLEQNLVYFYCLILKVTPTLMISKKYRLLVIGILSLLIINPVNSRVSKIDEPNTVEVATVVAVAQLAVSTAQLYFDHFNGDDNYEELTIHLLNRISSQLSDVNRKVDIVLENLEEIKRTLEYIPEDVARELNQRNINSMVHEHRAVMELYSNHMASGRSKPSWTRNKLIMDRIDKDLDRLRAARNQLFNDPNNLKSISIQYDKFLVIPLISLSLYMEYDFMVLRGIPKDERLVDLNTYRSHLIAADNKLNSLIMGNKTARDTLNLDYSMSETESLSAGGAETYYGTYNFVVNPPSGIELLKQKELIQAEDLFYPMLVNYSSRTTNFGSAHIGYCDTGHVPQEQWCPVARAIKKSRSKIENGYNHWMKNIEVLNLDNYYYWSSLKHTATESLNFLNKVIEE